MKHNTLALFPAPASPRAPEIACIHCGRAFADTSSCARHSISCPEDPATRPARHARWGNHNRATFGTFCRGGSR